MSDVAQLHGAALAAPAITIAWHVRLRGQRLTLEGQKRSTSPAVSL